MAHYAYIGIDNTVTQVVDPEQDFTDSDVVEDPTQSEQDFTDSDVVEDPTQLVETGDDTRNIVKQVIVAEQDFIDSGVVGDPTQWIQTSYNTRGGVHYGPDGKPDDGVALRKNFASIGDTYDPVRDAFIAPQPYASWVLDEDTCLWNAPVPYPTDGEYYVWDEATLSWVLSKESKK